MKRNHELNLKTLVCLTIVTVIIATFFSLANYKSSLAGNGSGEVAMVALSLDNESSFTFSLEPIEPNNKQSFEFEIFNKKKSKNTEVTMKYYLEIADNYSNLPLVFSIYKLNDNNEYELLSLNSGRTKDFYLGYSKEISDKYKLVVSWNEDSSDYNDYRFSGEIDFVKINVISEQVD